MQYPTDEFSLETFPGVTFTQPSATLDFSDKPVAGWFIEPGMLRKVRFNVFYMQTNKLCSNGSCIHMQITIENIDIQRVILRYHTDGIKSSEILKQLENHKQYPPRLSLEVFRSQHAQEHLKTDVTINGIEPQLICRLFTLCPGIECTIV